MRIPSHPAVAYRPPLSAGAASTALVAAISFAFCAALPARAVDSDGDGLSDQAEALSVRTVPFGAAAPVASAVGGPGVGDRGGPRR